MTYYTAMQEGNPQAETVLELEQERGVDRWVGKPTNRPSDRPTGKSKNMHASEK